ncbi:MAG: DUF3526 domain-containing protein [Bacteroidota bacterium]
MWHIIKNEWRFFGRTKLLFGISIGFVVVLVLSIILGQQQGAQQMEERAAAQAQLRAQWDSIEGMNPHGAAHYGTYVYKPRTLLSHLDEGVNSVTGNVIRVEGHVQNEIIHSEASQMQAVSRFGKLKSALLLQYIIPLLLVFLAFSAVSGEKQSGRLRLLVMQGASPRNIIFSKTVSVWLYGVGLLLLVVLTYSVLNAANLNGEILVRTLLFFLAYALFYFIITGLTVFLSARWQNATLALTTMLGVWILWSIFLPYMLMSSVEKWYPLPSREAFKSAMREDRSKGIDGHNPSDKRGEALEAAVLAEYGVDSLSQLPINYDGLLMQADEEYGNIVWDKHFGELRESMGNQKKAYQFSGLVNPFASLQMASMGFTGTDNLHHQDFLLQVENYRRDFIKTLNDEHAYGGSKTGDWYWEADNAFYQSVADFSYQPTAISNLLPNYLVDIGLLGCWSLLTFGLLLFATSKLQLV